MQLIFPYAISAVNPSSGPMGHLRNSESLETTLFLPRGGLLPLSRRDLSAMGRTFSSKTAKIVRGIIDAVVKRPGTPDLQISLCKEMVE
ncbi:hypothetical protein MUK42_05953 [Musa troglodytarum]|uniref:26S proteasome regulatory subunit Rpn6 N-terminal domain-containing protein n=1 Tax=Musa troglodytarum TaxID=320322 RepID=A0A9E7GDC1_9LILI|nr:hypothetical protein MUK42_05953 [Musa troglodytarum]